MLQRPVRDEMIPAHAVLGANTSSAVGGTDCDAVGAFSSILVVSWRGQSVQADPTARRSPPHASTPMPPNACECARMPFFGVGVDVALMLNAKQPEV